MYTLCRWYQCAASVACLYFLGVTYRFAFHVIFAKFMQTNSPPGCRFCASCNMFSLRLQKFSIPFSTGVLCTFQLTEPKGIFGNLSKKKKKVINIGTYKIIWLIYAISFYKGKNPALYPAEVPEHHTARPATSGGAFTALFCACPETPGSTQVGAYMQGSQKGGEASCLHSLKPTLINQDVLRRIFQALPPLGERLTRWMTVPCSFLTSLFTAP